MSSDVRANSIIQSGKKMTDICTVSSEGVRANSIMQSGKKMTEYMYNVVRRCQSNDKVYVH